MYKLKLKLLCDIHLISKTWQLKLVKLTFKRQMKNSVKFWTNCLSEFKIQKSEFPIK